jgi:hypothetical protein
LSGTELPWDHKSLPNKPVPGDFKVGFYLSPENIPYNIHIKNRVYSEKSAKAPYSVIYRVL